MIKIKIADFVIGIDNGYDFLRTLCKDYLVGDDTPTDFCVKATEQEINTELAIPSQSGFSRGYIESICVYRRICLEVIKRDAILVHSAVIELDGQAYAFLARSGTGKSTHIALWRRAIGDRVQIVNGDKPIYRLIDGVWYAYGTPWCGKEGWNKNTRAPLKALCYIERAPENSIEKISTADSATRLMRQILMPTDAEGAIHTLSIADELLKSVSSWLLRCNISDEAAIIAYEAMSKN